jgi:hypothetical protein
MFAAVSMDMSALSRTTPQPQSNEISSKANQSSNSMLLVGGAAPVVDCFMTPSSRTFSLSLL